MIAPAPPQSFKADEGAHEDSDVQPEAEKAMLTEDFEIHAVCVEGLVIVRAVVDGPDVLVPQGPEPCARERTAPRDVPGRLERLQTPHRGHITRLRGLLLLDRPEAVPEALGREGGGYDSRHEHGSGEPQPPR